jgi:hypothetical protein
MGEQGTGGEITDYSVWTENANKGKRMASLCVTMETEIKRIRVKGNREGKRE